MSLFLYFFPNKTHLTPNDVKSTFAAVALRDVLVSQKRFNHECVQNHLMHGGPGGLQGTLLTCHPDGSEVPGFVPQYQANDQEWRDINGTWLGWYKNNPPICENLKRITFLDGVDVELGDGRFWHVPTIRRADGFNKLPHSWGCDASGSMTRRLLNDYREAWSMACQMWEIVARQQETTYAEMWRWCHESLSINYRIGPHEADALQLLTDENHTNVIRAVVDWFTVEEMIAEELKKKEAQQLEPAAT